MTNETLDYVRVIAAHAATCTAPHGVESRSRMGVFIAFAARAGSKYSRRNAIFPAEARVSHPDDDEADAGPRGQASPPATPRDPRWSR